MSLSQQLAHANDPMFEKGMSEYEKARILNIRKNEAALRALGLDCNKLTTLAQGDKVPLKKNKSQPSRRRKIPVVGPVRFSTRKRKAPASYAELPEKVYKRTGGQSEPEKRKFEIEVPVEIPDALPGKRRRKAVKRFAAGEVPDAGPREAPPKEGGRQSIKYLNVDLDKLEDMYLGNIIKPLGGQVKRAAMECAALGGAPVFSRMSGIQQWKNAIMLFVNVYGDSYKNVFLNGGKQITWFAQNRQWEGTPVIQTMIHSAGAIVESEDGTTFEEPGTPILLFCRNLGLGYVYCGRLSYMAHDPERLPVRFVWQLDAHEELSKNSAPFQQLLDSVESITGTKC